jgi:hypothetical protein
MFVHQVQCTLIQYAPYTTVCTTYSYTIHSYPIFTRLDGNAIFIGGYARNLTFRYNVRYIYSLYTVLTIHYTLRNLTFSQNEFEFIGDSVMASWGDTSYNLNENKSVTLPYKVGPDGRGGEQPRGTKVALTHSCTLHHIQYAPYEQPRGTKVALTHSCTLHIYNMHHTSSQGGLR